ncbi:hypothetical protein FB446DRAFT_820249 [Lentinula raphanica]|nr:hypothetical protein FB446DRAFT_820249 [Lentinula raphanica]
MTEYDDRALRWRLLKQIQNHLRNHLVDHGEIPDTLSGVVDKLMVLDGARQAFNQVGLGYKPNKSTWNQNPEPASTGTTNETPEISNSNQKFKNNVRTPNARQATTDDNSEISLEAAVMEEPSNKSNSNDQERSYPRVARKEWNRRMKEGLCGICGAKDHRYRDHFRRDGPRNVTARGAFLEEYSSDDGPYVEIEGFDEPVHVDDSILEMWNSENEELARKFGNEQQELTRPIPLRLFDGELTSAGSITHKLAKKVTFEDGTTHLVEFLITKLHPSAPVVLGMPWLWKFNPTIDWKNLKVSFQHGVQLSAAVTQRLKPNKSCHMEIIDVEEEEIDQSLTLGLDDPLLLHVDEWEQYLAEKYHLAKDPINLFQSSPTTTSPSNYKPDKNFDHQEIHKVSSKQKTQWSDTTGGAKIGLVNAVAFSKLMQEGCETYTLHYKPN